MTAFKGNKEYFPGIDKIKYEGPGSKNPMAFKYYDANQVVLGKTMKEYLRFAVAYWHTFCGEGSDPFGPGTQVFPWVGAADPMTAAKENNGRCLRIHQQNRSTILLFPRYRRCWWWFSLRN